MDGRKSSRDGSGNPPSPVCHGTDHRSPVRDENGTVRRIKGSTDKAITEQMIADWQRRIERRKLGYTDLAEEHARRPLVEHLKDYAAHLEAKGDTPGHVAQTVSRIRAVFDGCGFVIPRNLDAGKVAAWLTALRRGGAAVTIPPGEAFSSSAVAKLVGLTVVRGTPVRVTAPAPDRGQRAGPPPDSCCCRMDCWRESEGGIT
jgi:hypothetical protein